MTTKTSIEFFREFTDPFNTRKKYILGINEYAEAIDDAFHIDGYIDDFTSKVRHRYKPIIRSKDIPLDSMVISTVNNTRPRTALCRLKDLGISSYCDYFSFADASNNILPQITQIVDTRLDFSNHRDQYFEIRSRFADECSRITFDKVLEFRVNANLEALSIFSVRTHEQYFENFLRLGKSEVFVDGGGYDGATSLEFIRRNPSYRFIYFFEPSIVNLNKAKVKLAPFNNIEFHQVGLFSKKETMFFDSNLGPSSSLSKHGNEMIQVNSLDNLVHNKVSFIKLDLEGAELESLKGMRNHIREDHPTIAVAVYHHARDFRVIPEYILSLRVDYELYLRHYTEGWAETIMFFVPVKPQQLSS